MGLARSSTYPSLVYRGSDRARLFMGPSHVVARKHHVTNSVPELLSRDHFFLAMVCYIDSIALTLLNWSLRKLNFNFEIAAVLDLN